jgi:outer membrane scaffolding protein for murein synthesis (MipA/OmpV family)
MSAPCCVFAQDVTLDTPTSALAPEQFGRLMSTTNRVGAGLLVEPTYPGGSGYRSLLLPDVDYTYNNRFFVNMEDGAGAYLYNDGTLSFSTSGFVRLGRDQTNSLKILGLGNIAEAPQGRFASEYDFGWIDVKGSFAHDFSGSYGNTFQGKLGTALPLTNQFVVLPAVTTSLGDHNYMQAWYGVSEFQSLATGKPFFTAHSGVESVARRSMRFIVLPRTSRSWDEARSITSSPMWRAARSSSDACRRRSASASPICSNDPQRGRRAQLSG